MINYFILKSCTDLYKSPIFILAPVYVSEIKNSNFDIKVSNFDIYC